MNRSYFGLAMASALAGLALVAGCANPDRSRDLNNPQVAAITIAQQVCSNCHGLTGNAVSPNFPNLAAQTSVYLAAQLKAFKSHDRQDPAGFEYMWGLSRSLTDAQIAGLADYYAAQKASAQPVKGPAVRVAAGATLFQSGMPAKNVLPCSTCHGDLAQGNAAFPRLAGQHADYLTKQLIGFQRTNDRPESAIMQTIAHELSADDIANVAAYLQSVQAP